MRPFRTPLACAIAVACAMAFTSGCAVGGGVFGTRIANGTATTKIKAGSVAVQGSGVSVGTTDAEITTD